MMEERRKQNETSLCGRRDHCALMEEESIERIAEKAAEKAISKMTAHVYQEIGRGIVSKLVWLTGVVTVALWAWLKSNGVLK